MRYLLDTNIISELVRPRPDEGVVHWVRSQSSLDLVLSVLVLGELEKGIATLPRGRRHTQLDRWLRTTLPRQFVGRLLEVDAAVALRWGRLAGLGKAKGRPLPVIDGLMLATADVAGLTLATRNVSDCAGRGVSVYDPWGDVLHG